MQPASFSLLLVAVHVCVRVDCKPRPREPGLPLHRQQSGEEAGADTSVGTSRFSSGLSGPMGKGIDRNLLGESASTHMTNTVVSLEIILVILIRFQYILNANIYLSTYFLFSEGNSILYACMYVYLYIYIYISNLHYIICNNSNMYILWMYFQTFIMYTLLIFTLLDFYICIYTFIYLYLYFYTYTNIEVQKCQK